MSTRCCIKVVQHFTNGKKAEVLIYHHHDGYPEGVGADLVKRSKKWDGPFKDRPYWDIDEVVNSLVRDQSDEYEFTAYNHVDIEYLYTIDCDLRKIRCNEATWVFRQLANGECISKSVIGKEVEIPGNEVEIKNMGDK